MLFGSRILAFLLRVITRTLALLLGVKQGHWPYLWDLALDQNPTHGVGQSIRILYIEHLNIKLRTLWIFDLRILNFKHYKLCGLWILWTPKSKRFEIIEHWIFQILTYNIELWILTSALTYYSDLDFRIELLPSIWNAIIVALHYYDCD